jgi:hypothetical protein
MQQASVMSGTNNESSASASTSTSTSTSASTLTLNTGLQAHAGNVLGVVPFPDTSLSEQQKQIVNMVHYIAQPFIAEVTSKVETCVLAIKEHNQILLDLQTKPKSRFTSKSKLKLKRKQMDVDAKTDSDQEYHQGSGTNQDQLDVKHKKPKSNAIVHKCASGEPIVVQLPLLLKTKTKKQTFYGILTKMKPIQETYFLLTFVPLDASIMVPDHNWSPDELNKKMHEHPTLRAQTLRPNGLGALFQGTTVRNPYFCWTFVTKKTPITNWNLDQCRRAQITWKKAPKLHSAPS